ncbi:MAG: MATE family efflux transporter [Victivallales bacterium]|nr:MATE family efflux transporter [Victivallales bacterium]
MFAQLKKKHFYGPGGILELLPIAIPMFLSSMFDMLMMLIDRLFLSHVGIVHQAAAMGGGMTSWMCVTLFAGVVGYSSALVAQYYGAGQRQNCVSVVWQAFRLSLISYPLVLLSGYVVLHYGKVFDAHSTLERGLETRYFWYMAFGSIISLLRFALGSFFSGIGRTRVILIANSIALFVNIIANWLLIFGHWGLPRLELDGAAIGTLLSGVSNVLVLAVAFFLSTHLPEYRNPKLRAFNKDHLWKLIRYGVPQGVENLLAMIAFVVMIANFHRYGDDMAAATTIAFNWDGLSFHPLIGIQVAVTTLVGQAMGKEKPELAVRVTRSGFKVAITYAACMVVTYMTFPRLLVGFFTPESSGLDYTQVREYAIPMLRLVGFYLITDAVQMISSAALRGAGDTFWSMVIIFCRDWGTATVILICVHLLGFGPLQTWTALVVMAVLFSAPIFLRYKMGHWKKLRIIKQDH